MTTKPVDTGKLEEARATLAAARASVESGEAEYKRTGAARAGVELRERQKDLAKIENVVAELEADCVAQLDAERAERIKSAKAQVAALATKREAYATKVDELIAATTEAIVGWLAVDDELFNVWPKRRGDMPAVLGRSRVMSILRECTARASAGVLSDASKSMAEGMRSAAQITADDNSQLKQALR